MKNKKIVAVLGVLFVCLLGIGIYIGGKSTKFDDGTVTEKTSEEVEQIKEEIGIEKIIAVEKDSEDENSIDSQVITFDVEEGSDKLVDTIEISDVKKDNMNEGKNNAPENSSVNNKQDTDVSDSRDPHTVENNKIPQDVDDIELPIIKID